MNIWAEVAACVWAHSGSAMGEAAKLREALLHRSDARSPPQFLAERTGDRRAGGVRMNLCGYSGHKLAINLLIFSRE